MTHHPFKVILGLGKLPLWRDALCRGWAFALVAMLSALVLAGCKSDEIYRGCIDGTQGCHCFANHTCYDGLSCSDDGLCKASGPSGAAGSVGSGAGGSSGAGIGGSGGGSGAGLGESGSAGCSASDPSCSGCTPGTKGCDCVLPGSKCGAALTCKSGVCQTSASGGSGGSTSVGDKCFTPCRTGYTPDGGDYRPCPADGLMAGCIGESVCTRGTCVAPDQEIVDCKEDAECPGGTCVDGKCPPAGSCEKDSDCTDFQTCGADGVCASGCDVDSDCGDGHGCYRHACRVPCSSDAETCTDGTYCAVTDGDSGFCMPLVEPDADPPQESVPGSFELSSPKLTLSNIHDSDGIVIVNHAPYAIDFTASVIEYRVYGSSDVTQGKTPDWLTISPTMPLSVDPDGAVPDAQPSQLSFTISDDAPKAAELTIEIASKELGAQRITLSYASLPDGRWAGKQYYFGQFPDSGVEAWAHDPSNLTLQSAVGNALVRKWASLRPQGDSGSRIYVPEFNAALQATLVESWRWPSVQAICPTGACYLYDVAEGYRQYTDDEAEIPTGSVELPVALDLKADGNSLVGRIASSESLHYAGNPAISLDFDSAPDSCTKVGDDCAVFMAPFVGAAPNAQIAVGGRYRTTSADQGCAKSSASLELVQVPWLVAGFSAGTEQDDTGQRFFSECRDKLVPFGNDDAAHNESLSQANPAPDGRGRRRALDILDAAMVNQDTLYVLFREYFEDPLLGASDTSPLAAYGMMVLHRANASLDDTDFTGTTPDAPAPSTIDLSTATQCTSDLIVQVLGTGASLTSGTASYLARGILDGVAPDQTPQQIATASVHYLCHDTGLFDQGPRPSEAPVPCPAGSGVTFFTGSVDADLSTLDCQQHATCQTVLDEWKIDASRTIALNPVWRCTDSNQVYCDTDRIDLRNGKQFLEPVPDRTIFPPLHMDIENAFRYVTEFQNREGKGLGFAPAVCVPDSNVVPYCYDPPGIESVEGRVNCLTWVFNNYRDDLDSTTRDRTQDFLTTNYSYKQEIDPNLDTPIIHNGFEYLNAQLLITQGDDAFTRAFQSRFDLAGVSRASFAGSKFEPGGIDLSGVAGFELYTLYQAVQYYDLVLNRFFALAPQLTKDVSDAISSQPLRAPLFVTQETATTYVDRVLRALTQKSQALSEIAKRYQSLQRSDLAKSVVERAYTGAYLESMVLTRLMTQIMRAVQEEKAQQLRIALEDAQRQYYAALLEMRDLYTGLSEDVNLFGFAPDYIPFPELDPDGPNAFEVLMTTAKQSTDSARTYEQTAIDASHAFDTSTEQFQQELSTIQNTYENQLAGLCGTFTGNDGNVYPALQKYAYLDDRLKLLGDPCGLVGNGSINDAIGGLEEVQLEMQGVQNKFDTLNGQIGIEQARITAQCQDIKSAADYECSQNGQVSNLDTEIGAAKQNIEDTNQTLSTVEQIAELKNCESIVGTSTGGNCIVAGLLVGAVELAVSKAAGFVTGYQTQITQKQQEISDIQAATCQWKSDHSCDIARIDSDALVKGYLLQMKDVQLQALQTDYKTRLALSQIDQLRNQAARTYAQEQDAEQMAINVEAARNDPNVRIYKNDAVINADLTFNTALGDAYKATVAFEYYSSQSYAQLDTLPLVRLVSRGDYTLDQYLSQLGDDYAAFSESFGRPDTRVDILSLRDDILSIPRQDGNGRALSEYERTQQLRNQLTDPALLDEHGYLRLPFSTSLTRLSPVTRDHKILYIEAEIEGSDVGDTLGRVYLDEAGTSVVHSVDDQYLYYRFPERMAVIDTFFNGVRAFGPDVYRNDRLRDRPYSNTHWQLMLNQVDETRNQDINLNAITDIRLYVYYTDFTTL